MFTLINYNYLTVFRSDLDTFPAPPLVGSWPDRLLLNKYMTYTFKTLSKIIWPTCAIYP
jgi:hypothetical protein